MQNKSIFDISLVDLLEAGSHFGHQVRRWNPKMKPFIWQEKDNVHVFDLAITAKNFKKAAEKLNQIAGEGGKIVFVGTKRQAKDIVLEEAKRCEMPYVVSRWPGGLFTNWDQIKKSIDSLLKLKEDKEQGRLKKYTKKENVVIEKKIIRLERLFGGLEELKGMPQAIFVIDTQREKTAVKEAITRGVPVFAIIDSNSDPDLVDYPIPANDDAVRSIKIITEKIATAVLDGVNKYKKKAKETKNEPSN